MNQFEMKQRAYQSSLKSRALQVLLYLIDRAGREQTCFPAVPTIGRELHISISNVKRAMKELVESGYVTKESRFRTGRPLIFIPCIFRSRSRDRKRGRNIQRGWNRSRGTQGDWQKRYRRKIWLNRK